MRAADAVEGDNDNGFMAVIRSQSRPSLVSHSAMHLRRFNDLAMHANILVTRSHIHDEPNLLRVICCSCGLRDIL